MKQRDTEIERLKQSKNNPSNGDKQTIEDLNKQVEGLTTKYADAQKSLEHSQKELETISNERNDLSKNLKEQVENLSQKIKTIEQERDAQKSKVDTLTKQYDNVIGERNSIQDDFTKIESENSELKKSLRDLKKKKKTVDDQLPALQEQVKQQLERISILENTEKVEGDVQEKLVAIKRQKNEADVQVISLQKHVEKQTEHVKQLEELLKQKENELTKLRESKQVTGNVEQKLVQVQGLLESSEKEKRQLSQQLDDLKREFGDLSSKHERVARDHDSTRKEFLSLQNSSQEQKEKTNRLETENQELKEAVISLKEQLELEKQRSNVIATPRVTQQENTNVDERIVQLEQKIQELHLENANRKLHAWEIEQDKFTIVKELQETRKKLLDTGDRKKDEQIKKLQETVDNEKQNGERLSKEVEQQSRELRELQVKMRGIKEFNEELKGEVAHLRQKLAIAEKRQTAPSPVERKSSLILNPVSSHALYRKQQILLDPLGSLKRSVLAIIEYFDSRVDQDNVTIDTIGFGQENPKLVHIIHTQLCAALVAVFQNGFNGPFWFTVTSHYWHMIEEIVESYSTVSDLTPMHELTAEQVLALELRKAVKTVNGTITKELTQELTNSLKNGGNTNDSTSVIPSNEFELKFRSLVICLLNDKQLGVIFKFLMHDKHKASWKRFYDGNALLRQVECQNKLITYLTLLVKLPFTIAVESTCQEISYTLEDVPEN